MANRLRVMVTDNGSTATGRVLEVLMRCPAVNREGDSAFDRFPPCGPLSDLLPSSSITLNLVVSHCHGIETFSGRRLTQSTVAAFRPSSANF